MRWRCRAPRCMWAANSRRRAATRPMTSRNGMGAVGRRSVRGWGAVLGGAGGRGGDGYGAYVNALAVSGSNVYAGGDFTMAGGSAANDIAQWNGSTWSALGSGISGRGSDGYGPYVRSE